MSDDIAPEQVYAAIGTKADVKQTVPVVLYSFLKFDNYKDAVKLVKAGGDTDTNYSILCALYGAKYNKSHFDTYHVDNVENTVEVQNLDNMLFNRTKNLMFFPRS